MVRLWDRLEFVLSWLFHGIASACQCDVFLCDTIIHTLKIAVRVTLILHVIIFEEQVINVQYLVNWIARIGIPACSAQILSCERVYHGVRVSGST